MTEDEMVGWHHQLNGHEFEQTPGDSEGGKLGMLQSMKLQRVRHDLATEEQSQRPHPVLRGAQKPRWPFSVVLPWGKGGGYWYSPRIVQSLHMGCQWEGGTVLCEVALLRRGHFLEDDSSERPLLSTLAAAGGEDIRTLERSIWVEP